MSNGDARPLNLLLGQARRQADFQSRLRLPNRFFGRAARHALEAGDEHAVGESLST